VCEEAVLCSGPTMHASIGRQLHGLEHFWSEHAAVIDLDPFVQLRVKRDLQRRLGNPVMEEKIARKKKRHVFLRCTGYTRV
jgi:hypothetical protein